MITTFVNISVLLYYTWSVPHVEHILAILEWVLTKWHLLCWLLTIERYLELRSPKDNSVNNVRNNSNKWCGRKSNETDFLLTMKFILFTNQGYPLQNGSLWQIHSDRGVVFIVRSSAGRLLLEYLSARRLCSSGCYPKY